MKRDALRWDAAQKPMDRDFIMLLFLVSVTDFALLIWRDTSFMACGWRSISLRSAGSAG
jgi:citrate/tricarballylate utilization protein